MKKIICICLVLFVIFGVCGCSTNPLISSQANVTATSSTESKSEEEEIVVIPTTSAKNMTSQEVIALVEEKITKINLPNNFKFTSGEIEYIYDQKNLGSYQTIDFILLGSLSVEQKNTFAEKLNNATWENSGVHFEKNTLDRLPYFKTLEDKRNRTNEQLIESTGEQILGYWRGVTYKSIYGYNTQLGINIYICKENSKSYKVIIKGQITNENPIEGLLQIQPDGSAKVKK